MATSRLVAMLLFALGAAGCVSPRVSTGADEAAIQLSVLSMIRAFNSRDDAALEAIATPDADWVTVNGRWTQGTAAYARARRSRFDGPLKDARLRPIEIKIRFIRPDVAVVHVSHEMSGMRDERDEILAPHVELSTRVYVKQDDRWVLTAFHNSGLRQARARSR